MTTPEQTPADGYKIGYGKPPAHTRFKPGQSGNPKGRPKKAKPEDGGVNVLAILDDPVTVKVGGIAQKMVPREVRLRTLLKKAMNGDVKATIRLLDQFEKHGFFAPPAASEGGGVILLPNNLPWGLSGMLLEFGEPPWTAEEIAYMRPLYEAQRTPEERAHDEAMGYFKETNDDE